MTSSSSPLANVDCPSISEDKMRALNLTVFWLEGVVQTVVAILGISSNALFSLILAKKELRNSFNILLIMLALFDSTYLLGAILESFRKTFHLATDLHLRLFPLFLYPMQGIALTGSVFMTVAIAFERYVAVHNPINYNRAMNDSRATRSRVLKYFVPVLLASVLFSLPKFFETTVGDVPVNPMDPTGPTVVRVNYTSFRVDPTYSRYVNWSKLLVQGVIPVILLTFFNKRIYSDIKERQKRWKPFNPIPSPSPLVAAAAASAAERQSSVGSRRSGGAASPTKVVDPSGFPNLTSKRAKVQRGSSKSCGSRMSQSLAAPTVTNGVQVEEEEKEDGGKQKATASELSPGALSTSREDDSCRRSQLLLPMAMEVKASGGYCCWGSGGGGAGGGEVDDEGCGRHLPSVSVSMAEPAQPVIEEEDSTIGGGERQGPTLAIPETVAALPPNCPYPNSILDRNARRRRVEDRLALLFMGIVAVFFLCCLPRILLSIYETVVMEKALACQKLRRPAFPVWVWVTTSLSHLLLVLNSSVNLLIYCLWNAQFRKVAKTAVLKMFGVGGTLWRRKRNDSMTYLPRRNGGGNSWAYGNGSTHVPTPPPPSSNVPALFVDAVTDKNPRSCCSRSGSSHSASSVVVLHTNKEAACPNAAAGTATAATAAATSNGVYMSLASKGAMNMFNVARACVELRRERRHKKRSLPTSPSPSTEEKRKLKFRETTI